MVRMEAHSCGWLVLEATGRVLVAAGAVAESWGGTTAARREPDRGCAVNCTGNDGASGTAAVGGGRCTGLVCACACSATSPLGTNAGSVARRSPVTADAGGKVPSTDCACSLDSTCSATPSLGTNAGREACSAAEVV